MASCRATMDLGAWLACMERSCRRFYRKIGLVAGINDALGVPDWGGRYLAIGGLETSRTNGLEGSGLPLVMGFFRLFGFGAHPQEDATNDHPKDSATQESNQNFRDLVFLVNRIPG